MWKIAKRWGSPEVAAVAVASQDHSTRATLALQKLVELDPAFGSLSLWCKHRDATPIEVTLYAQGHDTAQGPIRLRYDHAPAYTNGETVFYGAGFAQWKIEEQMAVCAHEIMHIACRHVSRGRALQQRLGDRYSHALFNIATDALINETLRLSNHRLPKPHVMLQALLNLIPGQKQTLSQDFVTKVDAEMLYTMLADVIAAGGASAKALVALSADMSGDLDGTTAGISDAILDAEWQARLARALSAGQRAGRGIGVHAMGLADLPKPRVPWEIVLRRLVTKAVTFEPRSSYNRPARRWLALDADARAKDQLAPAYIPGIERERHVPRIAVCLDVSGSMPPFLLQRFGAEIASIGRRTRAELHLIIFDHGIQLNHRLKGFDLVSELQKLRFRGGGGTSFVEPIEAALAINPSAIVVLTDLYGPFGDAPGRIPVFWACPQTNPKPPPFGRVVPVFG
jgi:predicted metal-dependent peptidase